MKEPTTDWQIKTQQEIRINRSFLENQGWILKEEKPLYESFVHSKDELITCSIGLYGEFSIQEAHWCNRTPERYLATLNPTLSEDDYFNIIRILRIRI